MADPYHHPSAEGAPPIRVEIAWTRKSLGKFMRHYYMWRFGWTGLTAGAFASLTYWLMGLAIGEQRVAGTLLAFACFLASQYWLWGVVGADAGRRLWDKNDIFQNPMTLTFTATTLEIGSHDRRILRTLDSFRGLRETGRVFLLTMSPDAFYVIPKSAFADDAQRAAFRDLVLSGVPKSSPAQ